MRAQCGLTDGLNPVATLHSVEVLISNPNSWKVEYAKSPLVYRAADGSPEGAGGDAAIRHNGHADAGLQFTAANPISPNDVASE